VGLAASLPCGQTVCDTRTRIQRPHHQAEHGLQRAMERAIQAASIAKNGSCHLLRVEDGCDIRTVREPLR
jgi:hypothetical protein